MSENTEWLRLRRDGDHIVVEVQPAGATNFVELIREHAEGPISHEVNLTAYQRTGWCFHRRAEYTGTPDWQNRWTCSDCGKHFSR